MSAIFDNGTPIPGATPLQIAEAMVADPAMGFATDPNHALSHALTCAADAHQFKVRGESWCRDSATARLWTRVAVLLVEAADDPYLTTGQLPELVAIYGAS